jgi:hypothetical protein
LHPSRCTTYPSHRKVSVRTSIRTNCCISRMGIKVRPRRQNPWYSPLPLSNSDPQQYLLRDKDNEKKWNMRLEQSVVKARTNNRQLLKDYRVYISTHVKGNQALLRILETHGAEARIVSNAIKGRAKVLRTDYLKTVENQVLVCTPSADDKALREKFREEVREAGLEARLYSSEWIMISVLRQEIEDGSNWKDIAILG